MYRQNSSDGQTNKQKKNSENRKALNKSCAYKNVKNEKKIKIKIITKHKQEMNN